MKKIAFLIFPLLLSACGFHLKGVTDIPTWLKPVEIINQSASQDLYRNLSELLKDEGITNTPNRRHVNQIILIKDELVREITNVAASTAPRQYQLYYSVHYQVVLNHQVIKTDVARITRRITINNDRILGSNAEEETTIRNMHYDAAGQIVDQLSVLNPRI